MRFDCTWTHGCTNHIQTLNNDFRRTMWDMCTPTQITWDTQRKYLEIWVLSVRVCSVGKTYVSDRRPKGMKTYVMWTTMKWKADTNQYGFRPLIRPHVKQWLSFGIFLAALHTALRAFVWVHESRVRALNVNICPTHTIYNIGYHRSPGRRFIYYYW